MLFNCPLLGRGTTRTRIEVMSAMIPVKTPKCMAAWSLVAFGPLLLGCEQNAARTVSWLASGDSTASITIAEAVAICDECIRSRDLLVLGDLQGPGYVENTERVLRDNGGRYWVMQPGGVLKVFDASGTFVAQVGGSGQGPLEFSRPLPINVDSSGYVHIVDAANQRVSVIGPDFTLHAEVPLPMGGTFNDVEALLADDSYVANMWLATADRIGYPLHIIAGQKLTESFGTIEANGSQDPFRAMRVLAVDSVGRIYSAKRFAYDIQVWSSVGRRVVGMLGPRLNENDVKPTFYNLSDNPLPNEIDDLQVHGSNLWILSRRRKNNWQSHMVERLYPDGLVGLQLRVGSTMDSVYVSRLEVVSLQTGEFIARRDFDELLTGFIGPGLVLRNISLADGTPQLAVHGVNLLRE